MDEQTRSILQKLVDQIRTNTKAIASLQASNTLQTHAIMTLLGHMGDGKKFDDQFRESYLSIRETAQNLASIGGSSDDIEILLKVLDQRFL